mgnify:CR=1 FL=1
MSGNKNKTMKKGSFLIMVITIFCFTLAGCNKNDFPKVPYPRVKTLPVSDISFDGATVNAMISSEGDEAVTGYGFEWKLQSGSALVYTVSLSYEDEPEIFTYDITSGLLFDSTYSVRAFVTTSHYKVYGEYVSFKSKGCKAPVIKSLSPAEGTWGDTITIRGKYFSPVKNENKVSFGNRSAVVAGSTDSTIVCIVPENITDKTVPVKVNISGYASPENIKFVLITPVIESISPHEGTFDDIVTITGKNFNATLSKNIVKFNDISAEILSGSKTSLIVKVPRTIRQRENIIKVTMNLQSSNTDFIFTILSPEVTSISALSGYTGDNIQINGNNFNPQAAGNIVKFGNLAGGILSCSKNTIVAVVPKGVYDFRSFPINIAVGDQSVGFADNFTLLDTWIRKTDMPSKSGERYLATAFSINGIGYVGLGDGGTGSNFWKYDPTINKWNEIAPFPGTSFERAAGFVIAGKAYVGVGKSNDLWSYDPGTNSWTKKADFPASANMSAGFAVNGKGYVVTRTESSNFYSYDPVSDTWTKLKDFPISGYYPFYPESGFVIDNRIFVCAADYTTEDNQLWEYDIATDSWIRRANLQGSGIDDWVTGFSVRNVGYIRGESDLYRYNLASDSWTILPDKNNITNYRGYSCSFEINGLVYFGGSFGMYGTDDTTHDLWEFNPDYL